MGCEAGQALAETNPPLPVLYMWSWWLGVSRSLPFQHLYLVRVFHSVLRRIKTYAGKWWIAMIPALQGLAGKAAVSGKRVMTSLRHVYRRPGFLPSLLPGAPTVMRKPWIC